MSAGRLPAASRRLCRGGVEAGVEAVRAGCAFGGFVVVLRPCGKAARSELQVACGLAARSELALWRC